MQMVMPGVVGLRSDQTMFLVKANALTDFPHEHARARTFRWGEDGIAGVSDTHGLQNIAFAFWNEKESVQSHSQATPLSNLPQRFPKRTIIWPVQPTRQSWREHQRSPFSP